MLFDVRSIIEDGVTTISVVGDVDLASLPTLAAETAAMQGDVTLDLSGVDWFDPLCLGVILAASSKARRQDAQLRILASSRVLALFTETRLDEILDVVASEQR